MTDSIIVKVNGLSYELDEDLIWEMLSNFLYLNDSFDEDGCIHLDEYASEDVKLLLEEIKDNLIEE